MKFYRGWKYEQLWGNFYLVVTPEGFKRQVSLDNENELRWMIDQLIKIQGLQ
jgi:hypothetical protein